MGHTSSYALEAEYVRSVYKTHGPYVATVSNNNTASFLLGVTSSITLDSPNLMVEFEGDIKLNLTGSGTGYFIMVSNYNSGPPLNPQYMIGSSNYDLNPIPSNNYKSKFSITLNSGISASVIRDFSMKGHGNFATGYDYYIRFYGYGLEFDTTVRPLTFWIHSKYQNINVVL